MDASKVIQKKTLTRPIKESPILLGRLLLFRQIYHRAFFFVSVLAFAIQAIFTFVSIAQAETEVIMRETTKGWLGVTRFRLDQTIGGVDELVYALSASNLTSKIFDLRNKNGDIIGRAYEEYFNRRSVVSVFKVNPAGYPTEYLGMTSEYDGLYSSAAEQRSLRIYGPGHNVVGEGPTGDEQRITFDGEVRAIVKKTSGSSRVREWQLSVRDENEVSPLLLVSAIAFERHAQLRRRQYKYLAGTAIVSLITIGMIHKFKAEWFRLISASPPPSAGSFADTSTPNSQWSEPSSGRMPPRPNSGSQAPTPYFGSMFRTTPKSAVLSASSQGSKGNWTPRSPSEPEKKTARRYRLLSPKQTGVLNSPAPSLESLELNTPGSYPSESKNLQNNLQVPGGAQVGDYNPSLDEQSRDDLTLNGLTLYFSSRQSSESTQYEPKGDEANKSENENESE